MEVKYKLELTKKALKDVRNLKAAGLREKTEKIRNLRESAPYDYVSKELSGELKGKRSIRINLQHRLVYEILEEQKVVKILSMWGITSGRNS
jgi:toxin YoeB